MATTISTSSITLRISTDLVEALDRAAKRTGSGRDELVERIIQEYVDRQPASAPTAPPDRVDRAPTRPRVFGIIDGSPVSSEDFEDWLYADQRRNERGGRP